MNKITIQDMVGYLFQMEKSYSYLQGKNERLEKHIEELKNMIMKVKWINPDTLNLKYSSYSKVEIEKAFMKAKVYEGLKTNEFDSVLDTFIGFLDGTKPRI